MRPFGSPESLHRRRLKAIVLMRKRFGPGEIARRLSVDRRSIHRWLSAFQAQGTEGLAATPATGRPPKLSAPERTKLSRMLLQGATTHGFPTDLWTGPRVIDLVRRRFRVTYHPNHIAKLLRSLGFSPQKPERRARERNEEAIRGWVHDDWPRVKNTLGG